jgi:multidrug resistance efflux pump
VNQNNESHATQSSRQETAARTDGASLSDRVRSLRLPEDSAGQRSRRAWLPWVLCAVFALAAAALGIRDITRSSVADSDKTDSPGTGTTPNSGTAAAVGDVVLESKGNIVPVHQIQVSPQVGGEIIWLDPNFKEGAVYKKGDRLAEVDPVIYTARLAMAEAALHVAETNLTEVETGSALKEIAMARAQLNNLAAKLELSRIDERNKRRAGFGTARDDMEKASAQMKVDEAAHEAQKAILSRLEIALEERRLVSRAQLLKAKADVQEAAKNVKNCTIVCPTTGIILTKKAELGGYVNPLAFGAAGYLCEVANLADIEVDLLIQERDIDKVDLGQKCVIRPDANPQRVFDGSVSRMMPVADRGRGAVFVRVKVDVPTDKEGRPEPDAGKYLLPERSHLVSFLKRDKKR